MDQTDWSTDKTLIDLATRAARHIAKRIERRWKNQSQTTCLNMRNCGGFRHLLAKCLGRIECLNAETDFYIAFARHVRHQLRLELSILKNVTVKIARKGTYLKVQLTPRSPFQQGIERIKNSYTESEYIDRLCS